MPHCSKPIEIPINCNTEFDYCQKFRIISKPFKHECVKEKKKPFLLEHPKVVSNFIKSFIPSHSRAVESRNESFIPQSSLKQSFAIHEDELLEEMLCMIKNHKLAKQKVGNIRQDTSQTEEERRLFVSNSFTMKFLKVQDIVLITVSEELQISQSVDASFHLRVGKIVKKLDFDECLVEVGLNDIIVVPSFCLCLQDRVLFDRMQIMRNKKIIKRQSHEEFETLSSQTPSEEKHENLKPKRKFKSC